MSVIRTKQNMVCAYEAGPDDVFVKVVWHGPGDGKHAQTFETDLRPIDQYEEALAWAVGMADQMRFPLHVVPLDGVTAFRTEYMQRAVATMTEEERGELRRLAVARLAEVMRDCPDPDVRSDAYDLLIDMKVVRP